LKLLIFLGSGTTGGVFAPSLVVGGGLGAAYATACQHFFPRLVSDPAFYSLVAMAAVFGGIARAPFTSIVFLFELSHNPNSLLPLIVSVMIADGFVRLCSRDSIMTVKLVKRGLIVLQDYSVPVLMRARIDQVMHKQFNVLQADDDLRAVLDHFVPGDVHFIPIVEKNGSLVGIVEPHDLLRAEPPDHHFKMRELARRDFVIAYPGQLIDQVHRDMMLKNTENVIVVDPSHGALAPYWCVRRRARFLVEAPAGARGIPERRGRCPPLLHRIPYHHEPCAAAETVRPCKL